MKRGEYAAKAKQFRELLMAESLKTREEQSFPDEWLVTDGVAVCHTPGCAFENVAMRVRLHENADGVHRVICGTCKNYITDVTGTFEDGAEKLTAGRGDRGPDILPPRPDRGEPGRPEERGPVQEPEDGSDRLGLRPGDLADGGGA